jgi:hypothetical protein
MEHNEFSIAVKIVTQGFAQTEAIVVQDLDHLFGIPTGNGAGSGSSSSSTSVTQARGTGSGASSSATTPNPQPPSGSQATGRGSGSGAAVTARENNLTHGTSKVQPLTSSGSVHPLTGSGSGSGSVNVYTWDPQGYGSGTGKSLGSSTIQANDFHNWLKNGQVQLINGTIPGNKPTDEALFDGSVSNAPIDWNQSFTFSTMAIGGIGAYTGLQTLEPSDKIDLTGVDGGNAGGDNGASDFNFHFDDYGQIFEIDKNFSIDNMDVTGYSDDTIYISGGTTTIAAGFGYTENLGVSLMIGTGGTLNHQGYIPLTLTNDNLVITDNGTMKVEYGSGQGINLIDSGTHQGDYIYVGSDLTYLGSGNVENDTFTVPVYLYGNTSVFKLQSAQRQPSGGKLTVIDQSNYFFPNGSKESVYLDDSDDQVLLTQGAWLKCSDGYYQGDGLLTTDNTACSLTTAGVSSVTITGGVVTIDNVPNTYNILYVSTSVLNFSAELDVKMDASNPGTNDKLSMIGKVKLNAGSTLSVRVDNGPPMQKNKLWYIIVNTLGNVQYPITGNFKMPITTNPVTALTPLIDGSSYELQS